MFRILSSKRYCSLIGRIADDQETIKGQAKVISAQTERIKELSAEIERKQKSIEYCNEIIRKTNAICINLRRKHNDWNVQPLDFPSTERIPDPKTDINQILEQ